MLKIGILGLGNQGFNFLKSYADLRNARLVSVCDIDNNKLVKAKNEYKAYNNDIITTTNTDDFLSTGLDIAVLCIPTNNNQSLIEKILGRNINILCSMPLAESLDKADLILNAVKKSKAKILPANLFEYFSSNNEFRNIIKRGKIGDVGFMRVSIGGGYPSSYNDWLDTDELGGGVILNLGVHPLYYLINLFGQIKRVYARRRKTADGTNKKDYALILIRFDNDTIVHLELSWAYPDGTKYISKLDAFGTNGELNYDDTNKHPITLYENKVNEKSYNLYNEENPLAGNPYRLVTESFINYLETKSGLSANLEDSIYALKVALSCLKSANENKVVYI